ncbi:MAG: hypothetical protein MR016_09045 [Agathobacter sp.]|nr:hypothetical protein [Agathobacter sp.]
MKKDHVSVMRVIPLLIMTAATVILSCVFSLIKEIYWDEAVCVCFVDMLFLMIFIYELEYDRKNRLIANNIATNFSKIAGGYVLCCIINLLFLICPAFYMPVMLFPLIMCAVGNEFLGISAGLFFVIQYAMIFESTSGELVAYTLMILLAGGLAKTLSNRRARCYVSVLLLLINIMVPAIFGYLATQKSDPLSYLYGAICGAVTAVFSGFLFYRFRKGTDRELANCYLDILSDDYPEIKKVREWFPAEYAHAKKVSDIALLVAKRMELDSGLCGAAGFYYRLGKWSGKDYVQAGIERAQNLNFPIELICIIAEYNGEVHKPSTPESAIVHMIDALTIKLEALDGDVAKSTWNREMIIYQTLNEFSSAGLYDESGLSMNQFLKVREFLVKEKQLL